MLWYKGWLETRLRLLFSVALLSLLLYLMSRTPHGAAHGVAPVFLQTTVPTFMAVFCAMLAGAGIATQPAFQLTKGLHGSMLFTLSLPVTRLRLLAVRAAIGWLELAAMIGFLCCAIWLAIPLVRTTVTPFAMCEYAATLIVCLSSVYFLSVLLATFLEDQWRVQGTMLVYGGWWWVYLHHASLPASTNIFQAMGKASPLFSQTMPWPAMVFSLALSAVFFVASLRVVQTREY
ncbi:MAG: hypothetical protein ABR910_16900 [Acidobacteriaceae bacterium]|jgi:hypothetical protein